MSNPDDIDGKGMSGGSSRAPRLNAMQRIEAFCAEPNPDETSHPEPEKPVTPEMREAIEAHGREIARLGGFRWDWFADLVTPMLASLVQRAQAEEAKRVWTEAVRIAHVADPGPVYKMGGALTMNAFEHVENQLRAAQARDEKERGR